MNLQILFINNTYPKIAFEAQNILVTFLKMFVKDC